MPENDVWPPKPSLPDSLTEYDGLIATKITALPEARRNRFTLIRALRDEEGMTLWQAYAVVNNYCERCGDFDQTKTSQMSDWLKCASSLVALGFLFYWMKRRNEILVQPHHHAALIAINRQMIAVILVFMLLAILSVILSMTSRRKK